MSEHEVHQTIGRKVLEREEVRRQVALVAVRLRHLGSDLLGLSQQLKEEHFDTAEASLRLFQSDVVDLSALLKLIEEHRDAAERLAKLNAELSGMGVN